MITVSRALRRSLEFFHASSLNTANRAPVCAGACLPKEFERLRVSTRRPSEGFAANDPQRPGNAAAQGVNGRVIGACGLGLAEERRRDQGDKRRVYAQRNQLGCRNRGAVEEANV